MVQFEQLTLIIEGKIVKPHMKIACINRMWQLDFKKNRKYFIRKLLTSEKLVVVTKASLFSSSNVHHLSGLLRRQDCYRQIAIFVSFFVYITVWKVCYVFVCFFIIMSISYIGLFLFASLCLLTCLWYYAEFFFVYHILISYLL